MPTLLLVLLRIRPRPATRRGSRLSIRRLWLRHLAVRPERDVGGADALLAAEELRAVEQAALVVVAAVHEIGVVEGQLGGAVDDVVHRLDAQHEAVVLVADLVAPRPEAAARPDVLLFQGGEKLLQGAFALERRRWVAVVEAAVVGGYDLVCWLQHFRVNEPLDRVPKEVLCVDGLHRGFGDFEHYGPVRARLR